MSSARAKTASESQPSHRSNLRSGKKKRTPPSLDADWRKQRNKGKARSKGNAAANPFLSPLSESFEAELAKNRADRSNTNTNQSKASDGKQPTHPGAKPKSNPNHTSNANSTATTSAIGSRKSDSIAAQPTTTSTMAFSTNARDVIDGTMAPELQRTQPRPAQTMFDYPSAEENDIVSPQRQQQQQQQQDASSVAIDTGSQQQEEKDATQVPANSNTAQKTQRRKGTTVNRLCSALSYLSIQNRLASTSSSSSLIFQSPPCYTARSGSRYTIQKKAWFETNAAHYGAKPQLVANTTETDQIDDHMFVRMAQFVEEPRCQRTTKELQIEFTETGFVLNKDLKRIHVPTFVKRIGECFARMDEQLQDAGKTDVMSLVLTHPSFARVRNKYDQEGMTECFRSVLGSMVDRTVRLKSHNAVTDYSELAIIKNPLV